MLIVCVWLMQASLGCRARTRLSNSGGCEKMVFSINCCGCRRRKGGLLLLWWTIQGVNMYRVWTRAGGNGGGAVAVQRKLARKLCCGLAGGRSRGAAGPLFFGRDCACTPSPGVRAARGMRLQPCEVWLEAFPTRWSRSDTGFELSQCAYVRAAARRGDCAHTSGGEGRERRGAGRTVSAVDRAGTGERSGRAGGRLQ
jgi:hypothetical protein